MYKNYTRQALPSYSMRKIYTLCFLLFALIFTHANAGVPLLGTTPDEIQIAVKNYKTQAENNNIEAQYLLGCMYFAGAGVKQSDAEAVKWWLKAAEQKHPRSMNNIGSMYFEGQGGLRNDFQEAIKWWVRAAEKGDDYAISNLNLEGSENLSDELKGFKERYNFE